MNSADWFNTSVTDNSPGHLVRLGIVQGGGMFKSLRLRTGWLIGLLGLCIIFLTSTIALSQELTEAQAIADK